MKGPTAMVLVTRAIEDLTIAINIVGQEIYPEVKELDADEEFLKSGALEAVAAAALELRLKAERTTWTKRN